MQDANWDLINGPDAHEIEYLNFANQINVIEALVKFVIAKFGLDEAGGCLGAPNAEALKAIHYVGTLFLLNEPGEYRSIEVHLSRPDGTVVYQPPHCAEVDGHMESFEADLTAKWQDSDPISLAAYALWRINWVHPFKNGNGRAARAFAYACLCLKFGFILPGQRTVIDLIMETKPRFEAALQHADKTFVETGRADLAPMSSYLDDLLIEQFNSIPEDA